MKHSITLKRDKDCKHSVRFSTTEDTAPVSSVYINRFIPGVNSAQTVTVEITIGGAPVSKPAPVGEPEVETEDARLLAALPA